MARVSLTLPRHSLVSPIAVKTLSSVRKEVMKLRFCWSAADSVWKQFMLTCTLSLYFYASNEIGLVKL